MTRFLAAMLVLAAASPAVAQDVVGHLPSSSPYRDLEFKQALGPYAGWWLADEGQAGVAPGSGPVLGVRYEFWVTGPVLFNANVGAVLSDRTVKDPARPAGQQVVGTESTPLVHANVGIGLSLTGRKSWNRLVPIIHTGVGVVSDLGEAPDVGGFAVGTPFAFTLGAAVRYQSEGRLAWRFDVGQTWYKLKYPNVYRSPPAGGGPPLVAGIDDEWSHNLTLTLGVLYQFAR